MSRVVFGAEPRDREVWEHVLTGLRGLTFSEPQQEAPKAVEVTKNPKRMQREAREVLDRAPLSTKAEEAIRLALEQRKKVRKEVSKAERDSRAEQLYAMKQEKKKKKKKGH